MSSGIDFDEGAARGIERIYTTPEIFAQRARCLARLDLRSGEHVLDVGLGPGLLASDMAAIVGESGRVGGVDTSEPMLEMSRRRCAAQPQIDFRLADAAALPFEDASFDALISTQVYEYVPDMDKALAEVYRVVRPGGRLLILDTDWGSLVWNSRDPARMRRVLDAWNEHLHDPQLPRTLGPRLRAAGFEAVDCEIIPILNPSYHSHCYSFGILFAIQSFVSGRGGISKPEAAAWASELRELGDRGEYFFSLNRYLFGAHRP